MMQVTIYSHNYAIRGYNRYGYEFLKKFGTDNFGEVDFRAIRINKMPSRFRKKPLPTIKKTYAACTADGREFRFHRNTLDMFKEAVAKDSELSSNITYTEQPMFVPENVGLKLLPHWVPRENQVPLISYFTAPGNTKILNLQTGGGKAQQNSEPVLTPTGWRPIGSLKVGDQVITPKGKIARVTGVYPQGVVDTYRFNLIDGRNTICCEDHLWKVYLDDLPCAKVMDTRYLMSKLSKSIKVQIPLVEPFAGYLADVVPTIDPYLFGFLYSNARKFTRRALGMALRINRPEIAQRLAPFARFYGGELSAREMGNGNYYLRGPGRSIPDRMMRWRATVGQYDFITNHKQPIDLSYMHGSVETRKQLLDGLLDGLSERGWGRESECWCIADISLREAVRYLCHSLGYQLAPISKENSSHVWILSRGDDHKVQVKSIIKATPEAATCISIDDPDRLYVTRDFIVTHNTFCSLAGASFFGERLCVSIESRFFNLWAEALDPDSDKQVLDLKKEEVLWIQGSKDFKALLQLALTDQLDGIKVIVIALRTFANYIETYLRFGKDMLTLYPVLPIEFFQALKVGTVIKDEVHLSLYANYMEELFTHVMRRFSLSATLEDGSFKDKIFGILFPMDQRFDTGPLKQYVAVTALKYRLRDATNVTYSVRGSSDYNHNAYEKWLISNRGRLNNYLKMILDWVDHRFLKVSYFEGQKAVVYVSSIEMASEVQRYLQKNIPHWTVSRYAASAGDIYDEAKQADILVTTEKSFSTGFDLPGLVCVLMTTAINSYNTNVQMLGRLRELLKHPDVTPIFDYFVCENIPKHIEYHEEKKRNTFKDRVKSHDTQHVRIVV